MSFNSNGSNSIGSILEGRLFVTVTSYEIHETSDREKFTAFKVQIKLGTRAWSVQRRYKEFYNLYNDVSLALIKYQN